MPLQKRLKYVLFDVPNTLLDSRHRTDETGYMMSGIHDDTVNYPAVCLLKTFLNNDYRILLTHYCLSRLTHRVELSLKHNHLLGKYHKLFTNFQTQDVYDNQTLKKHLYEQILQDKDVIFVVDNDPKMKAYWLNNDVALINVPLGIS